MPAPIRIVLSEEEDLMLSVLRVAQTVPQRTRDRAHMIRLNAQGWNVPAIAEIYECHEHTVRATLQRWQLRGLSGLRRERSAERLWEAPGRGAKASWSEADKQLLFSGLRQTLKPTTALNWHVNCNNTGKSRSHPIGFDG